MRDDDEHGDANAAMARAVAVREPGGVEVLAVVTRRVREPGAGEVRLAVEAAAVHPSDIGLREHGVQGVEPPWVPGWDAAGVVESVGVGVEGIGVGDAVMAAVVPRRPEGGAQSELIVVPAASVVPAPTGASPAEASTLPMNGLTALLGLDSLGLNTGDTIAVSGGAGLLASYVIPLARERGLRVVADAKPEDEDLVRSFGADVVLPRGAAFPLAVREVTPAGADGFFDTALLGRAAFPALRDGGGLVAVRGWDGPAERGICVHPILVSTVVSRTEWLLHLRDLASDGRIALRVAATFAPERAAEAHRLMAAGGMRGRAVIAFG